MQHLETTHAFLSDPNIIMSSVLVYGFAMAGKPSRYLDAPLSSLFDGAFNAFFYRLVGGFVLKWIPPKFRFIMPVLLGLSTLKYWFYPKRRQDSGSYRLDINNTETDTPGTSSTNIKFGPSDESDH